MKKLIRRVLLCVLAVSFFWLGGVMADRELLNRELIRFHVVANSDSTEDQQIKLQVRDAVLESLKSVLKEAADVESARNYLRENLDAIGKAANQVLEELGCTDRAAVTLSWENFCTRTAEKLSLPAGLYNVLRVTVGDGKEQNWWGVLFPYLYSGEACGALPASVTDTLTGEPGTGLRFFFLEKIGQLEKYLRRE